MKNNFLKSTAAFLGAGALLLNISCQKLEDFGDTNTNPLVSTAPITAALLTNVESGLGALAQATRGALYVQYISETQYTDVSLYQEPKSDFDGSYTGALYDLQSIINRNTDPAQAPGNLSSGSNANQIAVAKILKAYIMWTVTDRWGDVPYSEALKGAGNFYPSYDEQADIYSQLFVDLKEGIDGFDGGLAVRGDILYGGDAAKWKKLANTLRMAIAMRLSEVYPAPGGIAATQFAAGFNDPAGFMSANSDNLVSNFPGGGYNHPWFDLYNGRNDYALSKTLGDILTNMGDGRRTAYGGTGSTFPYGLTRAQAISLPTNYAKVLADAKRMENSPAVIVSAAYSLLTVAEGIERGWVAGNAQFPTAKSAYDAGITASFDQWGIAGAATYINGSAANYNTGTGGGTGVGTNTFGSIPATSNAVTSTNLERIWLQKYLALFPDGIQAWSEWRRTGFPEIEPTTNATNSAAGGQIPTRYVYGILQYSAAPDQVAEAVARLSGGDVMNAKVWWDQ